MAESPAFSGLATDGGTSAAEQVAEWLPGARVAKAFNTVFASNQADPESHGTTLDALYATSDQQAGQQVAELIRSLGLRPVNAGALDAARQMEALAWLDMRIQLQHDGDRRSAFVPVGAPSGSTGESERPATDVARA